ncbi:MAG: NYN domain-containing protein [Burkholderiales bacterium]|nr:NYN domain-containing protein [Burkholderiales bacterium]
MSSHGGPGLLLRARPYVDVKIHADTTNRAKPMALRDEVPKVGVYIDFENLHATFADAQFGDGSYRDNRMSVQPMFFDIAPILHYAASLGDVVICKAYANWQFFSNYRHVLNEGSVDLIQLFPRGPNMKNSADIRLALDCLSDVHGHDHLSHVVIVSCDSDFIPLVQRVKQAGRFVAGVGVTGRSSRFLVSACNEYKFYENLIPATNKAEAAPPSATTEVAGPEDGTMKPLLDASSTTAADTALAMAIPEPGSSTPSLAELEPVMLEVMRQLAEREENYIFCGKVKLGIKRRFPAFDEQALGFTSFKQFLQHFAGIVTFVDHDGGGHVALVEPTASPSHGDGLIPSQA